MLDMAFLLARGEDPNSVFGKGPISVPIDPVPNSHKRAKVGVGMTMLILGWTTFTLRAYTRLILVKTTGSDDLFMLITLVWALWLHQTITDTLELFFTIFCVSVMIIGFILNGRYELSGDLMTIVTEVCSSAVADTQTDQCSSFSWLNLLMSWLWYFSKSRSASSSSAYRF